MIRIHARLSAWATVSTALLASCASTGGDLTNELDFHVALIPLDVAALLPQDESEGARADGATGADDDAAAAGVADAGAAVQGDATAAAEPDAQSEEPGKPPHAKQLSEPLVLESGTATKALEQALVKARTFSRVTVLEAPPPEFGQVTLAGGTGRTLDLQVRPSPRSQYWVDAARDVGADLVVRGELRYDEGATSRLNGAFIPNLGLFLVGGPFCWFLPDRSYTFQSHLELWVYDYAALARPEDYGGARIGNSVAEIMHVQRTLEEVSMSFMKRASDKPGLFVASIFVPAGFLGTKTERVTEALEKRLVAALCQETVAAFGAQGPEDLLSETPLYDFWAEDIELSEQGVTAKVLLRQRDVGAMARYEILCGGKEVAGDVFEHQPVVKAGLAEYDLTSDPIDGSLLVDSELKVKIIDASSHQHARTFTVVVPAHLRAGSMEGQQ